MYVLVLLCALSVCAGLEDFDDVSLVDSETFMFPEEPRLLDNVFNFTGAINNALNSSLLTTAGFVIVGIILFEIALYALDVYYNQTYLGNQFYKKSDTTGDGAYYSEYPAYPDPYLQTFRSNNNNNFSMGKIVAWISLLEDAWGLSSGTFRSLDCQKRVICELWVLNPARDHGHIIHSAFQLGEYLNLPYEMLETLEELDEVKHGNEIQDQGGCAAEYPECKYSLQEVVQKYRNL